MPSPDFDLWKAKAQAVSDPKPLVVPLHVAIGESVEVAEFFKKYWSAGDELPGLESAGARLGATTGDDIMSLRNALQEAQTLYLLALEPPKSNTESIQRASFVLREITASLEWLLDDEVEEPEDKDLQSLHDDHAEDGASADTLAQALHDYGTLAKGLKDRLDNLGGFDVALIDEAFVLADTLGDVSQTPNATSKEAKEALHLRNQLASLLQDKVRLVRSAARFVFRGHPAIIRQATSAYERRRRAEARRKALQAAQG